MRSRRLVTTTLVVALWGAATIPASAQIVPPRGVSYVEAQPGIPDTAGTYEEEFTGQSFAESGLLAVRPVFPRHRDTAASGDFECSTYPHQYVSSYPAGLVIGDCSEGWRLHRTRKSNPVAPRNNYWEGGFLKGRFDGCGWIRAQWSRLVTSGSFTACGSPSRGTSRFASTLNCNPGPGCSDGTLLLSPYTVTDCPEYLNIRPWSDEPEPTGDPIRYRAAGYQGLKWRYVTRDGGWVMVRDVNVAEGQGNWVFVPRSCTPL